MIEICSTSAGGGDDGVHHTGVWGCLCCQSKGLVISCKGVIRQENLLLRHMVSPDISTATLRYQDNTKK